MTKAEYAQKYAALGWPVFPLHHFEDGVCSCRRKACASPAKHPRTISGVKDATTDPKKIAEWWQAWPNANIGVATGGPSGLVVFDFDDKAGGLDYKDDLTEHLKTLEQETGSGGSHFLFKYSEENPIGCRSKVNGFGLDIRGDGGYILVPPSNHASGQDYEWLDCDFPELADVEEMPAALVELLGPSKSTLERTEKLGVNVLTADELDKIKSALQHIDPIGEDWLFVGMALHEQSDGSLDAFKLWDSWAQTSPAHYLADEQEHYKRWVSFKDDRGENRTIATIYQRAAAKGWVYIPPTDNLDHFADLRKPAAASDFVLEPAKPVEQVIDLTPKEDPIPADPLDGLVYSSHEIAHDESEASAVYPVWGDHLIFKGGTTLIAGEPKIGKSLFYQSLSKAAALGRDFMGVPFKASKSIWFQAEIHRGYLKQRLAPMFVGLEPQEAAALKENFLLTGKNQMKLENDQDFQRIAAIIKMTKPDFICIDPLANYTTSNEIDNQAMSALFQRLTALTQIKGAECALVLIHHVGKGGEQKKTQGASVFDLIRGAGAIRGAYDTGIVLMKNKHGQIEAHFECRNGPAPQTSVITFNDSTFDVTHQQADVFSTDEGQACAIMPAEIVAAGLQALKTPLIKGNALAEILAGFSFEEEVTNKHGSVLRTNTVTPFNGRSVKYAAKDAADKYSIYFEQVQLGSARDGKGLQLTKAGQQYFAGVVSSYVNCENVGTEIAAFLNHLGYKQRGA